MGQPRHRKLDITRLLRPRLSDCIVLWALLGLCFALPMSRGLWDPDLWWHLQTGRLIVETRSIPTADPFSFTMQGQPWTSHEWLTEVVFWLTYSRFGFGGILLLKSLLLLSVFTVVFLTCRSRSRNVSAATAATAIAAIMSMALWSERPQLFGYLFLATLIWLIQRSRQEGSLWPVVPLFLLWINFHGSWIVGLAVFVAAGVEAAWESRSSHDNARLMSFARVLPFAAMALFVNPSPFAYVTYPFQYAGATHHTKYIQEWQSPNFHKLMFGGLLLFLMTLPALLRAGRARIRPVELLVVLGLLGAALYSGRHVPVLAIVAAPLVAEQLGTIQWHRKSESNGQKDIAEPVLMKWLMIAALPFFIFLQLPNDGPTPYLAVEKDYPVAAFERLKADAGTGKLLSCYNWGGYAIFHLWPNYRVYIDGRADVYGKKMMDRSNKLEQLEPGWRKELETADPDVIIWPADKPLTQALELLPNWKRVGPKDKIAATFVPVAKMSND